MKIETLGKYFRQSKRTKLYMATSKFLVAGYVSNPREEGDALLVDVGPYLIYSFARQEILQSSHEFKGLQLTADTRITRRFHTHLRHLKGQEFAEQLRIHRL